MSVERRGGIVAGKDNVMAGRLKAGWQVSDDPEAQRRKLRKQPTG